MDEQDILSDLYGQEDSAEKPKKPIRPEPVRSTKSRKKKKRSGGGPGGTIFVLILICAVLAGGCYFLSSETCTFGHIWKDATCVSPRYCRRCGETEGTYLGHTPGPGSCIAQTRCVTCDEVLAEAVGHIWDASLQGCSTCAKAFPSECVIPEDAVPVDLGDSTHIFKVFAISSNKWAANHVKKDALLFSFTQKVGWEDALMVCDSQGGRMAEISTPEIQEAVFAQLIDSKFSGAEVYFGLSDQEEEGQWKWLSGQEADWLNWHKDQPNGKKYENYAAFESGNGTWKDGKFNQDIRYFLCEWILQDME